MNARSKITYKNKDPGFYIYGWMRQLYTYAVYSTLRYDNCVTIIESGLNQLEANTFLHSYQQIYLVKHCGYYQVNLKN